MDLNVCSACGRWSDSPDVLATDAVIVCERCGHRQRFLRLPLFAVTGASGTGKSTAVTELADRLADRVVVLEQDLLWLPELQSPADDHRTFRSAWARMVAAIAQNGRPVLLAGTVVPGQLEACPHRRFIGDIHYLALVCDDTELEARLRGRPAWRDFSQDRIDHMTEFNRWIKQHAATTTPPMTQLDTSHVAASTTAAAIRDWVLSHLGDDDLPAHQPDDRTTTAATAAPTTPSTPPCSPGCASTNAPAPTSPAAPQRACRSGRSSAASSPTSPEVHRELIGPPPAL